MESGSISVVSISVVSTRNDAKIGLTECPGRTLPLTRSIAAIVDWRPRVAVTLVEAPEFGPALRTFQTALAARNISWLHFPIRNYSVPAPDAGWEALGRQLHAALDEGGRILIHCWGGLGRSGMIAARLLVERGERPDRAVAQVRAARPGAIETEDQVRWATRPART